MLINIENARDAREALRAVHSWLWAQLQEPQPEARVRKLEGAKDYVEEAQSFLRHSR